VARAERTESETGARRPRTTVVVVTLAVLLTGGVGAGFVWAGSGGEQDTESKDTPRVKTVAVTRTDLSDTREMEGTLGFGASRT
jgi:flagellar basal body-associated protein FliL